MALVLAATLLTWRVTAPSRSAPRRWVLVATATIGLLGAVLAGVRAEPRETGGGPAGAHPAGHGFAVTALRGPEAIPGATVRRYNLDTRTASVTLPSGRRIAAWTFNGRVPGPPITATKGDLVVDWTPGRGVWSDQVQFVFDGGVLTASTPLRLAADELTDVRWLALPDARTELRPSMYRRIALALAAVREGITIHAEFGRRPS